MPNYPRLRYIRCDAVRGAARRVMIWWMTFIVQLCWRLLLRRKKDSQTDNKLHRSQTVYTTYNSPEWSGRMLQTIVTRLKIFSSVSRPFQPRKARLKIESSPRSWIEPVFHVLCEMLRLLWYCSEHEIWTWIVLDSTVWSGDATPEARHGWSRRSDLTSRCTVCIHKAWSMSSPVVALFSRLIQYIVYPYPSPLRQD